MRYGRASRTKDGNVIVPLWLIFDVRGNVRMTRGEPDLNRTELAMQLTVTVPLALFNTPTISASLTIDAPEMAVSQIDVVAAAEAIKGALGCDVDVRVNTTLVEIGIAVLGVILFALGSYIFDCWLFGVRL